VRRHATASSSGPNERKPSGPRSSSASGRLRLTILLAALGALMLVPAASAFATNYSGNVKVNIAGTGSGKVAYPEGLEEWEEELWRPTSPPIECKYNGSSTSGTCEAEVPESEESPGFFSALLNATAAPGSELSGWTVQKGASICPHFTGPNTCLAYGAEEGDDELEVTATFCLEGQSEEECLPEPTGPTNLRTLTVTKNANGPGGTGSVSSKPKGIKCGTTCSEAVAKEYKNTPVVLTEKPGTTSTFVEWTGACSGSSPTCTVPMSEDESVGAVFAGTSKTITPTEALTVSKGESTGKGTVKAAGLGCEAECTSTTVLYQGPITLPKAKAGKTVVLKQAPAFGSTFSGWTGCDTVTEAGECVVEMDEAHTVEAEYDALPNKTLTVNKSYAKGNGSVSSKPKGIKCGATCTQAVAQMPEGAAVELVAKPTTGTFVKWEGGDCNGSTSTTCVVTMNADETTTAVFSDPGKAIAEAKTLTLDKEGSAFGTVKASGLTCEVLCSSTSALYTGPITLPKAKPGKVVVLKATSAPGAQTVQWTGCDSNPTPGECVVEMDEDHTVSAGFDELE
jgi:Divergent InlB B-repeat domain